MKFLDYIKGLRKGKEAQRIEREAMNDPFLSDAIDGYDLIQGKHNDRIHQMRMAVSSRATMHTTKSGGWKVAVAAVALIALLSGYFALMNHESSMAQAIETENSYINLYAPEMYIEEKRLELTAMMENNPSEDIALASVVTISNLDEVIRPVEVMPLYLPDAYVDKAMLADKSTVKDDSKKIFIADASTSIIGEAKVTTNPDRLRDAWTVREETTIKRSRSVGLNENLAQNRKQTNQPTLAVVEESVTHNLVETKANAAIEVSSDEARLLAEGAGFEDIEEVDAKALDGNVLELNEKVSSKRKVTKESYYRPRQKTGPMRSLTGSTSASNRVKPEPLIGEKNYNKYLKDNIIRSENEDCVKNKGKVIVQISVDQNGNPTDLIIKKSLCPSLDKEAIRLIKDGPKWTYGTLRVDVEVEFR